MADSNEECKIKLTEFSSKLGESIKELRRELQL